MKNKLIVNDENPNGIVVEMTAEELAQIEKDIADNAVEEQNKQQAKAQKEADAFEANAKLLSLGLTQAQVTAMTGYTPPVAE
jgi:hypothetical protein